VVYLWLRVHPGLTRNPPSALSWIRRSTRGASSFGVTCRRARPPAPRAPPVVNPNPIGELARLGLTRKHMRVNPGCLKRMSRVNPNPKPDPLPCLVGRVGRPRHVHIRSALVCTVQISTRTRAHEHTWTRSWSDGVNPNPLLYFVGGIGRPRHARRQGSTLTS